MVIEDGFLVVEANEKTTYGRAITALREIFPGYDGFVIVLVKDLPEGGIQSETLSTNPSVRQVHMLLKSIADDMAGESLDIH
jgi:hypothetical protein